MTLRRLVTALACVAAAHSVSAADEPAQDAPDRSVAGEPGPAPTPSPCAAREVTDRLGALLRTQRYADLHHAAVGLRVLCPPPTPAAWRVLDDIALLRLEDRPAAFADLDALAGTVEGEPANVVLAWAYVTDHDAEAARVVLARLPEPRARAILALGAIDNEARFDAAVRGLPMEATARALAARYRASRQRSPALAGVMSALVPGVGQLYAGSLQAAAATFVLNGLMIGATVELAASRHYVTAGAAGMAASFFYVGGIMNAVDLARRRNRLAMQPHADALERLLVPELDGR